MFVTNGKVITTKDQTDLASLEKFIESVFNNWATIKGKEVIPESYYEERERYSCYVIPEGMELNFLIEEGCEYLPIEKDDVIEQRGYKNVTYKYNFTAEESANNADQLARFVHEGNSIEAQKKEIMSGLKAQKDEADAKVAKFANFVTAGYMMKDEDCKVVLNFQTGKRQYFSKETNLIVKEENLHMEDRQLLLGLPFAEIESSQEEASSEE
jgi:hypothetical protein